MEQNLLNKMLSSQKSEISEYQIYLKLAKNMKNVKNSEILKKIAAEIS